MDAVKLDNKMAVEKTVHGWHIFAYFEKDGEIDKYPHWSSVTLSDAAFHKLVDQFCGEDGSGCDLVGDLRSDLDKAVNSGED